MHHRRWIRITRCPVISTSWVQAAKESEVGLEHGALELLQSKELVARQETERAEVASHPS